jgi:hypothetical protein
MEEIVEASTESDASHQAKAKDNMCRAQLRKELESLRKKPFVALRERCLTTSLQIIHADIGMKHA